MLNQIRYHQQCVQIQGIARLTVSNVVSYEARDTTTGQRTVTAADGGIQISQYLSNSVPSDVISLSQINSIGLPGYISQKPA